MSATQTFRELTDTMRPQDPHGSGTGMRFETGEHGGDYPDNMPQAITMIDAQGGGLCMCPYESAARSLCRSSQRLTEATGRCGRCCRGYEGQKKQTPAWFGSV